MSIRPTFRHILAAAALAATLFGAGCAGQQKGLEQGAGIGVHSLHLAVRVHQVFYWVLPWCLFVRRL